MAVENLTLDSIIRRTLAEHHLTMHYYVPFLMYTKRGLKKLHYNALHKVVAVSLAVTDNQATLPTDFVDEVLVGVEVGDKIKPIGHGDNINKNATGNPFTSEDDFANVGFETSDLYEYYSLGGMYGLGGNWVDNFTVLRDQGVIRIDADSEITTLHLIYITSPKLVTNQSLVHPQAEEALMDYATWKFAQHNPTNRFDPQVKKREWDNSYRLLRASMNKWTITDIKRSVRRYFKQSPKN